MERLSTVVNLPRTSMTTLRLLDEEHSANRTSSPRMRFFIKKRLDQAVNENIRINTLKSQLKEFPKPNLDYFSVCDEDRDLIKMFSEFHQEDGGLSPKLFNGTLDNQSNSNKFSKNSNKSNKNCKWSPKSQTKKNLRFIEKFLISTCQNFDILMKCNHLVQKYFGNYMYDVRLINYRENSFNNLKTLPGQMCVHQRQGKCIDMLKTDKNMAHKFKYHYDLFNTTNRVVRRRNSHDYARKTALLNSHLTQQEFGFAQPDVVQLHRDYKMLSKLCELFGSTVYTMGLIYDPTLDVLSVIGNPDIVFTRKSENRCTIIEQAYWTTLGNAELFNGLWKCANKYVEGTIKLAMSGLVGAIHSSLKYYENDCSADNELEYSPEENVPCQRLKLTKIDPALVKYLEFVNYMYSNTFALDINKAEFFYFKYKHSILMKFKEMKIIFEKKNKKEITQTHDIAGNYIFSNGDIELKLNIALLNGCVNSNSNGKGVQPDNSSRNSNLYSLTVNFCGKLNIEWKSLKVSYRNYIFKPFYQYYDRFHLKSSSSIDLLLINSLIEVGVKKKDLERAKNFEHSSNHANQQLSQSQGQSRNTQLQGGTGRTHMDTLSSSKGLEPTKRSYKSAPRSAKYRLTDRLWNIYKTYTYVRKFRLLPVDHQFLYEVITNKEYGVKFRMFVQLYRKSKLFMHDSIDSICDRHIQTHWLGLDAYAYYIALYKFRTRALYEITYVFKYFVDNYGMLMETENSADSFSIFRRQMEQFILHNYFRVYFHVQLEQDAAKNAARPVKESADFSLECKISGVRHFVDTCKSTTRVSVNNTKSKTVPLGRSKYLDYDADKRATGCNPEIVDETNSYTWLNQGSFNKFQKPYQYDPEDVRYHHSPRKIIKPDYTVYVNNVDINKKFGFLKHIEASYSKREESCNNHTTEIEDIIPEFDKQYLMHTSQSVSKTKHSNPASSYGTQSKTYIHLTKHEKDNNDKQIQVNKVGFKSVSLNHNKLFKSKSDDKIRNLVKSVKLQQNQNKNLKESDALTKTYSCQATRRGHPDKTDLSRDRETDKVTPEKGNQSLPNIFDKSNYFDTYYRKYDKEKYNLNNLKEGYLEQFSKDKFKKHLF